MPYTDFNDQVARAYEARSTASPSTYDLLSDMKAMNVGDEILDHIGLLPGRVSTWETWAGAFAFCTTMERGYRLALGDLEVQRRQHYADTHEEEWLALCGALGVQPAAIHDWWYIANAVPRSLRNEDWGRISISHMRTVAPADIPAQAKRELLDEADAQGYTVEELRGRVRAWREDTYGPTPPKPRPEFPYYLFEAPGKIKYTQGGVKLDIDTEPGAELGAFESMLFVVLGTERLGALIGRLERKLYDKAGQDG